MIKKNKIIFVLLGLIFCVAVWLGFDPLADKELKTYTFYDRQDKLIGIISADGGHVKTWVALEEISEDAKNVFIRLEDKRFYQHNGLDFIAIGRAMIENIKNKKTISGASTITQQLAKNILGIKKRTWRNKIGEAMLALYLERRYSKAEILENYFNRIYYGNLVGGINTAARFYFQKDPKNLQVKEAVILALLAKSPVYNQRRLYNNLLDADISARLNYLTSANILTEEARDYYEKIPLRINKSLNEKILAPNFLYSILRDKPEQTEIKTALDYELQEYLENIVREELARAQNKNMNNAAVIVLENESGEILAYVGSADFSDAKNAGQIDGVLSYRQPGSAVKPFMYYMALQNGYSPAAVLPDIPMSFKAGNGIYNPRNYDNQYRGPVTMRNALGNSLNIPAIYLLSKVGHGQFLELLQQLGFANLKLNADYYGLGLVLGNGEVNLLEMARAYACLANEGIFFKKLPRTKNEKSERVSLLSRGEVFLVTDMLSDNEARTMAFGADNDLNFSFPLAAKTGTTKDFRDNWVVGYTTAITVAVWVGNHDRSEMHNSSGITGAGPIFRKAVLKAGEKYPPQKFNRPPAIISANVCLESGLLAGPNCVKTRTEIFTQNNLSRETCVQHKIINGQNIFIYPSIYRDWLAENFPENYQLQDRQESESLSITYPPNNTYFAVDPIIAQSDQNIIFKVNNDAATNWYVDGKFVGKSARDENLNWQLKRGAHDIEAVQGKQRDKIKINVY